MSEAEYRLVICENSLRNIDDEGYWDGTFDTQWEYVIYDSAFFEVRSESGFLTRKDAEDAGSKALSKLSNK